VDVARSPDWWPCLMAEGPDEVPRSCPSHFGVQRVCRRCCRLAERRGCTGTRSSSSASAPPSGWTRCSSFETQGQWTDGSWCYHDSPALPSVSLQPCHRPSACANQPQNPLPPFPLFSPLVPYLAHSSPCRALLSHPKAHSTAPHPPSQSTRSISRSEGGE
jgi:hypothetical protein